VAQGVVPEDRFRLVCRGWAEAGGSAEGGGGGGGHSRVAAGRKDVRLLACTSFGSLAGAGAPAWAPDADNRAGRRVGPRCPRRTAASVARVKWARSCARKKDWEHCIETHLCEETALRGDLEMLKRLQAKGP